MNLCQADRDIIGRLMADFFPFVGQEPVAEITPVRLLEVLRRTEKRGVCRTSGGFSPDVKLVLLREQRSRN